MLYTFSRHFSVSPNYVPTMCPNYVPTMCHPFSLAQTLLVSSPMSRPIRFMPSPDTMFEVTTRTMQSRLLMRPSPELNSIILGVIGKALTIYNVQLYLFVFLSNHYHMLVSALDFFELSRFMNHINSNIAREIAILHNWHDSFWSRRFSAIPVLDDESMLDRARYIISHGCKEGLVSNPGDWPGINCVSALTKGSPLVGKWINRTKMYADSRNTIGVQPESVYTTEYRVDISPLPLWADLSDAARQAKWKQLVEDVTLKHRKEQVLGIKTILSQDPHSKPVSTKRSPRPFCHAVKKAIETEYREAYRSFVGAFREAFGSLLDGHVRSFEHFPECYIPPFAYRRPALAPG